METWKKGKYKYVKHLFGGPEYIEISALQEAKAHIKIMCNYIDQCINSAVASHLSNDAKEFINEIERSENE